MGIYTNAALSAGGYASSDYTSVEPYSGSHFNFHELGIIAASECAANNNAFMKAIALNELAAYEQTGSTDVFYESVNIKGVFEKIKMFFKKIIEKIHKIFHTFVAKMSSWFGDNANFAKKYEKEIVKKWGLIKNDWEYKGFVFKHLNKYCLSAPTSKDTLEQVKVTDMPAVENILNIRNNTNINSFIDTYLKTVAGETNNNGTSEPNLKSSDKPTGSADYDNNKVSKIEEELKKFRENFDDYKDSMRGTVIARIKAEDDFCAGASGAIELTSSSNTNAYDSSEYTKELFEEFRNGESSPEGIEKKDILTMYGGSVNSMMTFIKDFDKIKSNINKAESSLTKTIDKHIENMNKLENDYVKENRDKNTGAGVKTYNELVIQATSLYQTVWGAYKEIQVQAFSALLQAAKDACAQAKGICVKVIGMNKKMTESYDYEDESSYNSDYSFISSVKLV